MKKSRFNEEQIFCSEAGGTGNTCTGSLSQAWSRHLVLQAAEAIRWDFDQRANGHEAVGRGIPAAEEAFADLSLDKAML